MDLSPENHTHLIEAADQAAAADNPQKAFDLYCQAIEIEQTTGEVTAHVRLGLLLSDHDHLAEASKLLEYAALRKPEDPFILLNAGLVLFRAGKKADAGPFLREAYSLISEHTQKKRGEGTTLSQEEQDEVSELAETARQVGELLRTEYLYTGTGQAQKVSTADGTGAGDTLSILFLQNQPCIRNYKTAVTLRNRGHRVTLAYTHGTLSEAYKDLSDDVYEACIRIKDYRQLWELTDSFDVVHSHNEPDTLTVAAMAGDAPVIHDTHDLISLRHPGQKDLVYFEGIANRGSAGRVYASPYKLEKADELYGIDRGKSIVTLNSALEEHIPDQLKPRLSKTTGEIHLVYQGGLGSLEHRDFRNIFSELCVRGFHLHIHAAAHSPVYEQLAERFDNMYYNQPVSPDRLLTELSQYDYGLVPFVITPENRAFLDTAISNKMFEYVSAGLPVIVSNVKGHADFVRREGLGIVFESVDDIVDQMAHLNSVDVTEKEYIFDRQIERLEALYRHVIADFRAETGDSPQNILRKEKDAAFYDDIWESGGWNGVYFKHYSECPYLPSWQVVIDWVKDHEANGSILDIGCGNGQFAEMAFDNGMTDYTGIDISSTAIEHARKRNEAHSNRFRVDNPFVSDILQESHSCVLLLEILEHVEHDLELLRKIPAGTAVILSVPNFDSAGHVRYFSSMEQVLDRYRPFLSITGTHTTVLAQTGNKLFLLHGTRQFAKATEHSRQMHSVQSN